MSLKEKINEDMKSAMRSKDVALLGTIRLIQAAIKQKEVDDRVEIDDTMILNIVTLPHDQSGKISLNLVGPIIINRRSLVGKQCIINNHEQYSARHTLDVGGESL